MRYLSILSVLKNENDYVVEFVEFYKLQGVEHFYFYDNDSETPLEETLNAYLDIVTITKMPGDAQQLNAYNHFLSNYKNDTEWVAVFDLDEYVLPKKHDSLASFIQSQNNVDCISINWVIFGNGKHLKKPSSGTLIENYLYSEGKQHKNIKSIVRPTAVRKFDHPHYPRLKLFRKHVNANGNKMKGAENHELTIDTIQLNHYYTKSLEEYQIKMNRKDALTGLVYLDQPDRVEWMPTEPERTSVCFEDEIFKKIWRAT